MNHFDLLLLAKTVYFACQCTDLINAHWELESISKYLTIFEKMFDHFP